MIVRSLTPASPPRPHSVSTPSPTQRLHPQTGAARLKTRTWLPDGYTIQRRRVSRIITTPSQGHQHGPCLWNSNPSLPPRQVDPGRSSHELRYDYRMRIKAVLKRRFLCFASIDATQHPLRLALHFPSSSTNFNVDSSSKIVGCLELVQCYVCSTLILPFLDCRGANLQGLGDL